MPLSEADCVATFKILVIGDASVGKTALLRCLTGHEFQEKLYPTIATDFVRRMFEVDGALVELQIWDSAGQERFRSVTRWQYRGVKGVVMVYDITDRSTFTHLSYWLESINQELSHVNNKYQSAPVVLLGNKTDLEDNRQVSKREGEKLADKELAFGFFETSAKSGQNVFDAFRKIAYHVTEVCNPNVMMSYHRNMIRMSTSLSEDTNTSGPKAKLKTKQKSRSKLFSSKPKLVSSKCTVEWIKPLPQCSSKTVKLNRNTSKRRRKCCVVS